MPVIGIEAKPGPLWHVTTPAATLSAPVVVDAAGPWAAQVAGLANLRLPIEPRRHQVLVTAPLDDIRPELPTIIFPAQGIGIRPQGAGLLVGTTDFAAAASFDQDRVDRLLDARLYVALLDRLPYLRGVGVASRWAGLYDMTPDHHPILQRPRVHACADQRPAAERRDTGRHSADP
jgi:sarcosine oxidase subunit beta